MKELITASEPVLWLQAAGHTAYLVGNQVRDELLNISFDRLDADIATSATTDEVIRVLAKHSIIPSMVDEKFGVTTFHYESIRFEATTFRDDIYEAEFAKIKRYPDQVKFIKSAKKDALRRDLTINAIYYNPASKRFLDYVGGLPDLKAGVIREIGDPDIRFLEDPLRMLRAIRFKHALGFEYDPITEKAILENASLMAKVSPPVIKKELQKLQQLENYSEARADLVRFGFIKLI